MDIIYHGKCLDGVFSSFSMFVFLKLLSHRYKHEYKDIIEKLIKNYINNKPTEVQQVIISQNNPLIKKQFSFFYHDKQNKFTSILPGSLSFGIINCVQKQSGNSYVCLVDCYGQQTQYLQQLCRKYKHVIVIDHHISGVEVTKKVKAKNISIVFNQQLCAFELVNKFLTENFHFDKMCPESFFSWMKTFEKYIHKNDLKVCETIQSKQFILGYYNLDLNMNDSNSFIYKQLSNLEIKNIISKGKKLYEDHMKKLIQYSQKTEEINFNYKGKKLKFLGIQTNEVQVISDLGIIVSQMSCLNEMQNLSMFYKYNYDNVRVSFRSKRTRDNPKALQIAQLFGGGGHLCAAGCKINKSVFNKCFSIKSSKVQKIQNIQKLLYTQQD